MSTDERERAELSDEQLAAVWNAAVVGQPFMGAGELHVKGLRAVIAADRAARPESVDARRYRWLRERYTVLCRMECARALGLDLSRVFVNTVEKFDAIVDAAIAKGEQTR